MISRPYQQRRAYSTCSRLWSELDILCASHALPLDGYIAMINDVDRVINMLIGDTQRIEVYAEQGFAIPQDMPNQVRVAYQRLVKAGFTTRLE